MAEDFAQAVIIRRGRPFVVYEYSAVDDLRPLYVGKGTWARAFDLARHGKLADWSEVRDSGGRVAVRIVADFDDKAAMSLAEKARIRATGAPYNNQHRVRGAPRLAVEGEPIASLEADLARPFVVYEHALMDGRLYYVGSGRLHEAAANGGKRDHWRRNADEDIGPGSYTVRVVEWHTCEARARLHEAKRIHRLKPLINVHHRNGPHPRVVWGATKLGARCDCGPDCYGREVVARHA